MMKSKLTENYKKAVRYAARKIAVRDANTTCAYFAYQPQLPKEVENLRKNNE
ncbi:MAG: cyclic lactone autoinducer peptide [Marvinbryantia sp.]|jgi:cyclic lactone autoinducer peptide